MFETYISIYFTLNDIDTYLYNFIIALKYKYLKLSLTKNE